MLEVDYYINYYLFFLDCTQKDNPEVFLQANQQDMTLESEYATLMAELGGQQGESAGYDNRAPWAAPAGGAPPWATQTAPVVPPWAAGASTVYPIPTPSNQTETTPQEWNEYGS